MLVRSTPTRRIAKGLLNDSAFPRLGLHNPVHSIWSTAVKSKSTAMSETPIREQPARAAPPRWSGIVLRHTTRTREPPCWVRITLPPDASPRSAPSTAR